MKFSNVLFSSLLIFSAACGEKKLEGEGKSENATADVNAKDIPATGTVPAIEKTPLPAEKVPTINVAEVISKLTWTPVTQYEKPNIYGGFDGVNTFRTVLFVFPMPNLAEDLFEQIVPTPEFRAAFIAQRDKIAIEADPAFMDVSEVADPEKDNVFRAFILTSKKAGTTTLKAKLNAAEAPLAVLLSAYTPEQTAAGRVRYTAAVEGATPSPSCASCHRAEGGRNHSPFFTSQYTDAGILSSVETGTNSDDQYKLKVTHLQTFATPEAKAGIVPYLRSLNPVQNGNLEVPPPAAPAVTPASLR